MLRPVAAPPGLPDDVRKTWQDAFWKATNDPEFQKKQIAANASPQPMRPQELDEMVEAAIKLLEQYKEVILKHRK
jgi:tripartite-type tricarboxylate transporter receptor subunit TctC